jgi:hypothetical protein
MWVKKKGLFQVDMTNNKSEVARLKQQIAEEYAAAQAGLSGLAVGVARHQFITARMERIQAYHRNLQLLVGEQEAMQVVQQAMEETVE